MEMGIFWTLEEKKNRERKGGKYLEKENFLSVEEKKNRLQAGGRNTEGSIRG